MKKSSQWQVPVALVSQEGLNLLSGVGTSHHLHMTRSSSNCHKKQSIKNVKESTYLYPTD